MYFCLINRSQKHEQMGEAHDSLGMIVWATAVRHHGGAPGMTGLLWVGVLNME